MSYNITGFNVKVIKDLAISLDKLVSLAEDANATIETHIDIVTKEITIELAECSSITGTIESLESDLLKISKLNCIHDWSAHVMHNVLEPLFKTSTGELKALTVWESGDSICYLIVNNGVVTWKDI